MFLHVLIMATYEPLDDGVEVNGQTVLSVVNAFPDALQSRGEEILAENGIEDPEEDEWYSQENWLNAFEDLYDDVGERTIRGIGKVIPESAEWPPGTETIIDGVESIDTAYHMNHREGEIGNYAVNEVDEDRGIIIVECDNPYPCEFDKGILEGVSSEFSDSYVDVEEIGTQCRDEGGDECLYEVKF